jgi:hypothetical protein
MKKILKRRGHYARNAGGEMSLTKEQEYFALNMAEAEKMFNLLQQAKKTISAVGHKIPCGFSGCTCGAVNTFKLESAEFWRLVQEIESGWPAASQKGEEGK